MTRIREALYFGAVVHKRLRPRRHALRYTVFSCLFDCNRLEQLDAGLRLFSYNRFNLFSLNDSDHTDSRPLQEYLKALARPCEQSGEVNRFMMLCYPRVLGYAFNPLTVYFGLDAQDRVRLVIYEVRNTFGERLSYVLPTGTGSSAVIEQSCQKRLYVSPFNDVEGRYSFHATSLEEPDLTVGVALKTADGPLMKAHFRGKRKPLTDAALMRAVARTGWMTLKVIAGIHFEALKLFCKGMRIVKRPAPPAAKAVYLKSPKESF